jgi:hypothetical protein
VYNAENRGRTKGLLGESGKTGGTTSPKWGTGYVLSVGILRKREFLDNLQSCARGESEQHPSSTSRSWIERQANVPTTSSEVTSRACMTSRCHVRSTAAPKDKITGRAAPTRSQEEKPQDKYLQSTYPLIIHQKFLLQEVGHPAGYALRDQIRSYV